MSQIIDEQYFSSTLGRLKLTGIRDNLDNLLDVASKEKLSYRELVYRLCCEEVRHEPHSHGSEHSSFSLCQNI
ncbi:hypothetical protein FACS1894187_00740 [Synergistales bacterium]|nr:hypothetical protein FACS1894187_00740 [Synergistales bacterium]